MDCIRLSRNGDRRQATVNRQTIRHIPQNGGNLLNNSASQEGLYFTEFIQLVCYEASM